MPSIVDALWISIISACAVLAGIHALTWLRWRRGHDYLLLSALCLSVAATGYFELATIRAANVVEYAWAFRWGNLMIVPIVVATVLFTLSVFPGRRWLAIAVIGTRLLAQAGGMATGEGVIFREITALSTQVTPWGDALHVGVGQVSPWLGVGTLSNLLLLAFLADAAVTLARAPKNGERRRQLRLILGVIVFVAWLLLWMAGSMAFDLRLPFIIAPTFTIVAFILSFEVSNGLLRSAELAEQMQVVEADLRQNRRHIGLVEESGGMAVWRWTPGTSAVLLSDTGRAWAGLAPGESFELQAQAHLLQRDDLRLLQQAVDTLLSRQAQSFQLEFQLARPHGDVEWVSIRGHAARSDDGKLECVHGVAFDTTPLRSSDQQFRMIVATSPNAILLVNEEGTILMANDAAMSLTGYTADELLGASIDMLVPTESRGVHERDRHAYVQSGAARRMSPRRDVLLQRKDGQKIPVEVALNLTRIRGMRKVVAMISDLSERIAMHREIASQRNMLAHLSRVALLSELSGSLAHEISQPLTTILSSAQASVRFMDRAEPDLTEVRDGLGQIIESSKRAGEVIRRLRSMLRKEPAEFVPVLLGDVIVDVCRILHSDLIGRGVDVSVNAEEDLPPVRGDPVQLQQVLINLLLNACDAMADGPLPRRVVLDLAHAEGGLELRVADNGHGIAPEDQDRITQPFFSTKEHGLGFGLALCNSLVGAHGGRLWFSTNPGGGTIFHVFLPTSG